MELTIMLLILTAMMLAVIMLSGLELTSNRILLSARTNAQELSQEPSSPTVNRDDELRSWHSSILDLTKSYIRPEERYSFGKSQTIQKGTSIRTRGDGSFNIPFAYQSSSTSNSGEFTLQNARYSMTASEYSTIRLTLYDQYRLSGWRELSYFDRNLKHDCSNALNSNAFNLASLVQASGDGSSAPATINRKDQYGPKSAENAADIMYRTFRDMFGVDITENKLTEHDTNQVFMPQH